MLKQLADRDGVGFNTSFVLQPTHSIRLRKCSFINFAKILDSEKESERGVPAIVLNKGSNEVTKAMSVRSTKNYCVAFMLPFKKSVFTETLFWIP